MRVGGWKMFGFGKRKKGSNIVNEQQKKAMASAERIKASAYAGLRAGGLYK